jgi:hypothetical protein
MQSVLNDEPVPPSERVDGLPEGTDEVVLKALEKRKEDRYESILDFRRDLEALVDEILREQKNQQSDDMVGTGQSASGKDDEEQDPFIYSQRKKSDSLSKRRSSGRDGPKKSSLSRKGNENKDRSEEGSKDQSSLTLVRVLGALVLLIAAVGVAIVAVDISDEADSGVSSTNERTVAVVVGLDTEAQQDVSDTLSQDEQRLLQRAQLAPEGLSSSERQRVEELQQEMNQSQQEAIEEASSEFESAVDSTDTVSVDGRIQEETSIIYLVSGISPEITNLLNHENVQSVISKDQYNQLARQQSKSTDE